MKNSSEIPRRARLDQSTSAELAIRNAVNEIEKAGADVRLTKAVILLIEARELVADVVDGIPLPASHAFTAPEPAPALREEQAVEAIKELLGIIKDFEITPTVIKNGSYTERVYELNIPVRYIDKLNKIVAAPSVAGSVEERAKAYIIRAYGNPVDPDTCLIARDSYLAGAAESEGRFAEWASKVQWNYPPVSNMWHRSVYVRTTAELYQEYLKQLNK